MVKRKVNKKVIKQTNRNHQSFNLLESLLEIVPKNDKQQQVFDHYDAGQNLVLYGCAGTGKSFIALYLALDEILGGESDYKKVLIIRSAVQGINQGFLPGTAKEKMAVYEAPYIDICNELFHRGDAYEILVQKRNY